MNKATVRYLILFLIGLVSGLLGLRTWFRSYSTGIAMDVYQVPKTNMRLELFAIGRFEPTILLVLSEDGKEVNKYRGNVDGKYFSLNTMMLNNTLVFAVCEHLGNNWLGYVDLSSKRIEELHHSKSLRVFGLTDKNYEIELMREFGKRCFASHLDVGL